MPLRAVTTSAEVPICWSWKVKRTRLLSPRKVTGRTMTVDHGSSRPRDECHQRDVEQLPMSFPSPRGVRSARRQTDLRLVLPACAGTRCPHYRWSR